MADTTIMSDAVKRVLFICGKCRQRSPTAEQIFSQRSDMEVDAAGLSDDGDVPISGEQIEWATHLVVMEKRQVPRLRKAYPKLVAGRRIVSLDIPDSYAFMQPELVDLLHQRIGRIQ